ncbi:unnamed protein product [Calypogeia fissa]
MPLACCDSAGSDIVEGVGDCICGVVGNTLDLAPHDANLFLALDDDIGRDAGPNTRRAATEYMPFGAGNETLLAARDDTPRVANDETAHVANDGTPPNVREIDQSLCYR